MTLFGSPPQRGTVVHIDPLQKIKKLYWIPQCVSREPQEQRKNDLIISVICIYGGKPSGKDDILAPSAGPSTPDKPVLIAHARATRGAGREMGACVNAGSETKVDFLISGRK